MKAFRVNFKLCVLAFLALSCAVILLSVMPRRSSKIYERLEIHNSNCRIRLTAYEEATGGALSGGYYVFEVSSIRPEKWRKILRLRKDDLVPIPRHQIRFVGKNTAYFYIAHDFAISTDECLSWFVWDATQQLPDWQKHRSYIQNVELAENGSGTMTLKSVLDLHVKKNLYTTDYGRTWR